MNTNVLLLIMLFFFSGIYYHKFYIKPQETLPTNNEYVVADIHDPRYKANFFADGNLDGKVTIGEIKRAQAMLNHPQIGEMYSFVESLGNDDRQLVQGLRFDVAKKVIRQLSVEEKEKLRKLNIVERVNLLNAQFSASRKN